MLAACLLSTGRAACAVSWGRNCHLNNTLIVTPYCSKKLLCLIIPSLLKKFWAIRHHHQLNTESSKCVYFQRRKSHAFEVHFVVGPVDRFTSKLASHLHVCCAVIVNEDHTSREESVPPSETTYTPQDQEIFPPCHALLLGCYFTMPLPAYLVTPIFCPVNLNTENSCPAQLDSTLFCLNGTQLPGPTVLYTKVSLKFPSSY